MELKITKVDFPQKIEFNFEELKQEITTKVGLYNNMVYTDDTIKEAKTDRATLKKFSAALENERKKVKKECLKPYEAFEKQISELVCIVDEPIKLIDSQVKTYEEKQKSAKLDKIKDYWMQTDHPEWLTCNQIFENQWLNSSTSFKKVQESIDTKLTQITADLETLNTLPEFAFEATDTYKRTLDINSAIAEGQRLVDIQRRKKEREAEQEKIKADAELAAKAANDNKAKTEPIVTYPETNAEYETMSQPKRSWVKFAACLTVTEAGQLAEFFKDRNIEFKPI